MAILQGQAKAHLSFGTFREGGATRWTHRTCPIEGAGPGHEDAASPYRASGPVFVRKAALERYAAVNLVPEQLVRRLLSVRAHDAAGMMRSADVCEGRELEGRNARYFSEPGRIRLNPAAQTGFVDWARHGRNRHAQANRPWLGNPFGLQTINSRSKELP